MTSTVEMGVDRSNMSTEWTLAPPSEPNVFPFNGSYGAPGVFEARRVAVFDGIARIGPQWFRDGFGADTPSGVDLFVDTVRAVHARGMKILATIGPTRNDFNASDVIPGDPKGNGCSWSTAPLSKIDLGRFADRVRAHFDALKNAGQSVDAFEIGNELDLYCNDADMPPTSEFAAHHWKWFLSDAQVQTFANGYVPFLKTSVGLIRAYFPHAKIITFGMSNPSGNSAALIAALAHYDDGSGKLIDETKLVDGYGTHIYPSSATTDRMVRTATADLVAQEATFPHAAEKPLWITEWNEAGSAFWSSHKWYFQYDANGNPGGDRNLAAGAYPAMTRAEVIRAFQRDVLAKLRERPNPLNIGYAFYYAYDAAAKSKMCDDTNFNRSRNLVGVCASGLIDPTSGALLSDVADAAMNR